jgi:hypothetical protein
VAWEHSIEATKAARGAIEVIDELVRGLCALRGLMVSEIQADEDARTAKANAILVEFQHPRCHSSVPTNSSGT